MSNRDFDFEFKFSVSISENMPLFLHNYKRIPVFSNKPKLAIFDLDDTLITTKSGLTYPIDGNDFQLKYFNVPHKLSEIHDKGFIIFIVTNQLGISKNSTFQQHLLLRLEKLVELARVPIFVLAAINDDEYRKPSIGSFFYIVEKILKLNFRVPNQFKKYRAAKSSCSDRMPEQLVKKAICKFKRKSNSSISTKDDSSLIYSTEFTGDDNNNETLPLEHEYYQRFESGPEFGLGSGISEDSFFCGDAAGRKNINAVDFNNTDLLYASNCKIHFYLPEQLFKNLKIKPIQNRLVSKLTECIETDESEFLKSLNMSRWLNSGKPNVVVLLVGSSSSGKTKLCSTYFTGDWVVVSYVA
jgi:DNA 3'-phosphatase